MCACVSVCACVSLCVSVCLCACVHPSLQETYETKRREFLGELQHKEEEMRQMFVNKVKETEVELKEKEREVNQSGRGWSLHLHSVI